MTPENFCYWLKGIFEIQEAGINESQEVQRKLTEAQVRMISQHLNYVFHKPVVIQKGHEPSTLSDKMTGAVAADLGFSIC